MKLSDLTKNVSNMTDAELHEHVKSIRHNKYVAKPAVAKRAADIEKAEKNVGIRKTRDLVSDMTAEQKLALLKLLEGDSQNG